MGYRTILVLSGGTQREDLVRYAYRPDLVVDSIADLCQNGLLDGVPGAIVSKPPSEQSAYAQPPHPRRGCPRVNDHLRTDLELSPD